MVDSYSDLTTQSAVRIVETCFAAGKPERIVPALRDHRSPESVAAELAAERAAQPTARPAAPASSSASAPAGRSIFGAPPTSAESDRLQSAIKQRMQAVYGAKPAG